MVYGLQDVLMLKQMLGNSEGDERHKRVEQHKLEAMLALCERNPLSPSSAIGVL